MSFFKGEEREGEKERKLVSLPSPASFVLLAPHILYFIRLWRLFLFPLQCRWCCYESLLSNESSKCQGMCKLSLRYVYNPCDGKLTEDDSQAKKCCFSHFFFYTDIKASWSVERFAYQGKVKPLTRNGLSNFIEVKLASISKRVVV